MRRLMIFGASFAAVLLAGVAFAQVGVFSPYSDEDTALESGHDGDLPQPSEEPREGLDLKGEDDVVAAEPDPAPLAAEGPKEEAEEEPAKEPQDEPAQEAASQDDETGVWLEILFPQQKQVVEEETLAFEGHVSADTRVFRGKYEADVTYLPEEGFATWRLVLVLSSGENLVTFEAIDGEENSVTASVVVFYEARLGDEPKDEPKEELGVPHDHPWGAYQKYGECGESPPYDVFYGAGTHGATVSVSSPYGGGETTIGDYGKWDLKVYFPEAPCGEEFKVVIESSEGDRSEFWFVRICEGGADK